MKLRDLTSSNIKYPLAKGVDIMYQPPDDHVLMWMTPKHFLQLAPSMGKMFDPSGNDYIRALAQHISDQLPLDGADLGADINGGHDGRHRAQAAILAGVQKFPVYVPPDMVGLFDEDFGWNDLLLKDLDESYAII